MLVKSKTAINNGQSGDTGNIVLNTWNEDPKIPTTQKTGQMINTEPTGEQVVSKW